MSQELQQDRSASQGVLEQLPASRGGAVTTADGLAAEEPIEVPQGFVIDSAEKASWAVRKILEARAYAARIRAWAETELRRAEHEEQWLLRRFGLELEAWLRVELQQRGGRRRSLNLPAGTLGLRRQPERLDVIDEHEVFG